MLFSPWLRIGEKKLIESDLGDGSFLKGTASTSKWETPAVRTIPARTDRDAKEFEKLLQSAGLKADADYKYTEVPGLEHNEPAFATRVRACAYLGLRRSTNNAASPMKPHTGSGTSSTICPGPEFGGDV